MFFADDVLNDVKIKVRFKSHSLAPNKPRWEQAFSRDNGETWETNWTMDFFATVISRRINPRWFSLAFIAASYSLCAMAKGIKSQKHVGTYYLKPAQRISYGFQLMWLSVFSIVLM